MIGVLSVGPGRARTVLGRAAFAVGLIAGLALRQAFAAEPAAEAVEAAAGRRPDILFVAIDDLNDWIPPLDGFPGLETPAFDRLARGSVTFANAHCAAPACHPSRVAVLTGVHPSRSGIYRNLFGAHGPRWRRESPLLADAVVLPQYFRDHGYRACGAGKIFHALQWSPGDSQNDPAAWDEYRGDPLNPIAPDWPRPRLVADAKAGLTPGRPLGGGPRQQMFGTAAVELTSERPGDAGVVDWAIERLRDPGPEPLFLAVGLFRPHIPWEVPQEWFDRVPEESVRLPEHRDDDLADARSHGREGWHEWVVANGQWRRFVRGYLASVRYCDHQVGRLLDALAAAPRGRDTIVVLWSDHGFHLGEKQNWEKFALWDQTTRVPLFIHAPGVSRDGAKTRSPVTLTDLYPTLCELAGLPVPSQCDGRSLVPLLRDPGLETGRLSLTSYVFKGRRPAHAVSDARYRYIVYPDGFEELYDLEADPHEFTNRAGEPELEPVRRRLAGGVPAAAADAVTLD